MTRMKKLFHAHDVGLGVNDSKTKSAVVTPINRSAFQLYGVLQDSPAYSDLRNSNHFFSPLSLLTAFAMLREGARGNTASEIDRVLCLPPEDKIRRAAFAALCHRLESNVSEHDPSDKPDQPNTLIMANALWVSVDPSVQFSDIIRKVYLGEIGQLDRDIINKWVNQKTRGKIPEIVKDIDLLVRFILTNALYFKGTWLHTFDPAETEEANFTLVDGRSVPVKTMHLIEDFGYCEKEGIQVLELPYQNNHDSSTSLSMVVLLPRNPNLSHLEAGLDAQKFLELCDNLSCYEVDLRLPRFKMNTEYSMVPAFQYLGMTHLFDAFTADFSGIFQDERLYVGEILHRAVVDVNEKGTEAAAVTSIVWKACCACAFPHVTFTADHPFIFAIVENDSAVRPMSRTILFLGRVNNPSESAEDP